MQDPTRGRTQEDYINGVYPLPAQSPRVIAHDYQMPYTWQSTIGAQGQVAEVWGIEADYTYWKGYNFANQRDPNLFFDPVTGYSRNPTTAGRPDPAYGVIQWLEADGKADYGADLRGGQSPVSQQLAGVAQLHAVALHARRHDELPGPGRQPVQPGGRMGPVDRVPAPHAAAERHLAD